MIYMIHIRGKEPEYLHMRNDACGNPNKSKELPVQAAWWLQGSNRFLWAAIAERRGCWATLTANMGALEAPGRQRAPKDLWAALQVPKMLFILFR